MVGQKVLYKNETYIVLHDYKNGQLEIKKENSEFIVELVKNSQVRKLNTN